MSGRILPTGSFIRTSILDSAALLTRGASKPTAPAAITLPKKFLLLTIMRSRSSEVELIDVFFVEDERQAQPHFVINYFNLAQSSGHYFVVAAFQFASC